MLATIINLLWLAIYIIAFGAVIYAVLFCIKIFFAIPAKIEQAVWVIAMILVIIWLLTTLAGGGFAHPSLHL